MTDIEALRTLRGQAGDAYLSDDIVGLNALCLLAGWRFEGDGRILVGPSGPVAEANRGRPDRHDNPALSVDAALALAEHASPEKWPGILRTAVTAQTARHDWSMALPKPGQRQELARAILLSLVESLIADADEASAGV